jgi:pyruvate/2-oxoacid:ferredoxin oxidoreductase beta subunit
MLIANATGCSSIYGGNLPSTPYTVNGCRSRSGLEQFAVRGQRRVRPRHAPGSSDQLMALRETAGEGDWLAKSAVTWPKR